MPAQLKNSVFDLSGGLAPKGDPALIRADSAHLEAVSRCIRTRLESLVASRQELMRVPERRGRGALDRDLEIHRLGAQIRSLRRYGTEVCLGRMVPADGSEPSYIGRVGLLDNDGTALLLDWRTPAAEPFFAATPAHPMGLSSRRRYRWVDGRITNYWDEALSADAADLALDQDSAILAGLALGRTGRMSDVLATIQADQDAIVRAPSAGALVVEGGPGTGKTVVALHRAAYLLYADPRLKGHRGGILVVGPHRPYLAYISDVLPSLGEEGVLTCTLADLVSEGATALAETDAEVALLKGDARMVSAVEPAAALYEEPPTARMLVETDYFDVPIEPSDWAEAFGYRDPETPHNEARNEIWETLVAILVDKVEAEELTEEAIRNLVASNEDLRAAFSQAWPILDPTEIVGDLWTVPAYLRRCAPWLSSDQVRRLQRGDPASWTKSDLPLLDAARRRIGDPLAPSRSLARAAILAEQSRYMDELVDYLLDTDDDPESSMSLLRRDSIREALVDEDAAPKADRDRLAGPFAHVIVDEAQELTGAEWQLLIARCPSGSFTIVGDRAQARHGFVGSWTERLRGFGFAEVTTATLGINYRTPAEVMTVAGPMIRQYVADANVPESIRSSGIEVEYAKAAEGEAILADWLATHSEGTACVIGGPELADRDRVYRLTPQTAKGLEFDLVILFDDTFGEGVEGAVDRYVSMTRTTNRLVILE